MPVVWTKSTVFRKISFRSFSWPKINAPSTMIPWSWKVLIYYFIRSTRTHDLCEVSRFSWEMDSNPMKSSIQPDFTARSNNSRSLVNATEAKLPHFILRGIRARKTSFAYEGLPPILSSTKKTVLDEACSREVRRSRTTSSTGLRRYLCPKKGVTEQKSQS